jgi:hypothetical protein
MLIGLALLNSHVINKKAISLPVWLGHLKNRDEQLFWNESSLSWFFEVLFLLPDRIRVLQIVLFELSCISTTVLRERREWYVGRSKALFSALVALVKSILRCCKDISSASVARLDSTLHDLCSFTEIHGNCITTNWSVCVVSWWIRIGSTTMTYNRIACLRNKGSTFSSGFRFEQGFCSSPLYPKFEAFNEVRETVLSWEVTAVWH